MKRENSQQSFEITFREVDEIDLKEHNHTFFEIVSILTYTEMQ
jgi:hypothetical protein